MRQRRPVSRVLCPGRFPDRGDDHFSRAPVTRRLQRPNPGAARATPSLPYLALLRVGFTEPARSPAPLVSSYLTVSPLPPRHPFGRRRNGGLFSVALVRGVSPPGRYPAPCPAEPGLSSRRLTAASDHPAFSGVEPVYTDGCGKLFARQVCGIRAPAATCRRWFACRVAVI